MRMSYPTHRTSVLYRELTTWSQTTARRQQTFGINATLGGVAKSGFVERAAQAILSYFRDLRFSLTLSLISGRCVEQLPLGLAIIAARIMVFPQGRPTREERPQVHVTWRPLGGSTVVTSWDLKRRFDFFIFFIFFFCRCSRFLPCFIRVVKDACEHHVVINAMCRHFKVIPWGFKRSNLQFLSSRLWIKCLKQKCSKYAKFLAAENK